MDITNQMSTAKINRYLKKYRQIKFIAGIYNLTEPLIVYSDTKIDATGCTFQRQHDGRMLQCYVTKNTTQYSGTKNVAWKGGVFIASTNITNANVIVMFHCSDIIFSNITVDGCRGLHSIEINASQNIKIENCAIKNQSVKPDASFREAIQIDFANKDGLSLSGANGNALCYDGTPCKNIFIIGCSIMNCPNGIGTHTISVEEKYHENINIHNCNFNQITTYGIKILGMKNVTIKKCNTSIIVNKLKNAHRLAGGKVELPSYRYNSQVIIDNIAFS